MAELKCLAFDCFGTIFNMQAVQREDIKAYVSHVRSGNFSPYKFPNYWYELPLHADCIEGMRRLQVLGFTCLAFSNASVELIQAICSRTGLRFDGIVDLVAHKCYKPNLGAYTAIQSQFGFEPSEIMIVTANPTFGDTEGATHHGMRSQVIRHGYPDNLIELAVRLWSEQSGQ